MSAEPSIINIHTPTSSMAIVHSITQENLEILYDKLSRKVHSIYKGSRVGPGWLKYEYNSAIWNLDDDSDWTIFVWREQQSTQSSHSPTIHLHDPSQPLPAPPDYLNGSYYLFFASGAYHPTAAPQPSTGDASSIKSKARKSKKTVKTHSDNGLPKHKRDFQRFHGENGVRTVMGTIGPVENVRMLLKSGYRHVYMSRKFAMKHNFIPSDATPGYYGYSGLVNIGTWPITLTSTSVATVTSKTMITPANSIYNGKSIPVLGSSSVSLSSKKSSSKKNSNGDGLKAVNLPVYLSEEPHFDVILGRSFFERRQIQTNDIDMTEVVCLDTGEKIECELVILKDGRGEIVTVT